MERRMCEMAARIEFKRWRRSGCCADGRRKRSGTLWWSWALEAPSCIQSALRPCSKPRHRRRHRARITCSTCGWLRFSAGLGGAKNIPKQRQTPLNFSKLPKTSANLPTSTQHNRLFGPQTARHQLHASPPASNPDQDHLHSRAAVRTPQRSRDA